MLAFYLIVSIMCFTIISSVGIGMFFAFEERYRMRYLIWEWNIEDEMQKTCQTPFHNGF